MRPLPPFLLYASCRLTARRFSSISGLIFVPKITIKKLTALGKSKGDFLIIAHDLPPTASVDGVLGLDFLRENVLTIDFVKGEIEFE